MIWEYRTEDEPLNNHTIMKKLLLLLAISPLFTNAQDNAKKIGKNISIGLSFSPNYNYRALFNKHDDQFIGSYIVTRNGWEKGKLGYSTGANVNFTLSKRFELQTGLFYSDKGYKIERAIDTPTSTRSGIKYLTSTNHMNYLDVPLKLNYISGEGRLKFIAGVGLSANFLLNQSAKTTYSYADGREETTKKSSSIDYNKFNISALASVGVQYKLKDNLFLMAEPTFQYGVFKVSNEPVTGIAEHLWNVGLNVGVHLKLK